MWRSGRAERRQCLTTRRHGSSRARRLALLVIAGLAVLTACANTQAQESPEWHLDRIDQRQLPLDGRYRYAHTGEGVRVYIVDDGVRRNHDFSDRLLVGLRLQGASATGDHGTRAAGAAAGTVFGVAKAATVVDVHAYDDPPDDRDHDELTAQAYQWIIGNHPPDERAVVVNAWGLTDDEDVVEAVRGLLDAGVCVVLSAGNLDEPVGESGALPLPDTERNPEIVVVGATTAEDGRWPRSSYGPHVDLYAPGAELTLPSGEGSGSASGTSGTSWSAPVVAGVMAMALEADPDLTCAQLKERVLDDATEGVISGLPDGSHNRLVYRSPR